MRWFVLIWILNLLVSVNLSGQVSAPDLTLIRSRFLLTEGKNEEALGLLKSGKPDAINQFQWYLALARGERGAGKVGESMVTLNSIAEASPAVVNYERALCAADLKDYESAILFLENHLSCPDHFTELEIKKEDAFRSLDGHPAWNRLWQRDWYSPDEVSLAEARYLINNGQHSEAVVILDGIVPNDQVRAAALFEKGRALLGTKLERQARELFRESISSARLNSRLLDEMAAFFDSVLMPDLALVAVNQLLLIDPTNSDYLIYRAIQRIETSTESVVRSEIDWLTDAGISSTDLFYKAGLRFRKSDPERAADFLTRAIDAGTLDARYYFERGVLRCRNNQAGEGLDDLAMSLDINPNQPDLYLVRGEFRLEAGDQAGACHDWRKAFEMGSGRAADLLAKHCR